MDANARITFLNILIAHTLAAAPTLPRFTQFFCERDVSGMRRLTARVLSPSLALPPLEYIYTAALRQGQEKLLPHPQADRFYFTRHATSATPIFWKMHFRFAERCRFAPWSSGLQPPPWPRRRACWGCRCPPARFGTLPRRPTTRSLPPQTTRWTTEMETSTSFTFTR